MSNGKPFKARLGLDANNEKVVNVAPPEVGTDVVNLNYYNTYNTLQPFSSARSYPAGFLVEYSDRVWKSRVAVSAADFDQSQWSEIHAFGRWIRITGNYSAEPGDSLVVNTSTASVTVTLPAAEDGDVVYIVDEGSATTNPIIVAPASATINGVAGNYEINTPGSAYFIYVGGTWKVNAIDKTTAQSADVNFTAKPNSFNIVEASAPRAVSLPAKPKDGQWVILQGPSNAQTNNITVSAAPSTIGGLASYVMSRNLENVTFIYSSTLGQWKAISNKNFNRLVETLTPLPNQQIMVLLDGTTKTVTLPSNTISGDWVEVLVAFSDEASQNGAILINAPAGTSYKTANSSGATSTSYRVKKRCRVLFFLRGTEWTIVHNEDGGDYVGAVPGTACAKNSIYSLATAAILPSRDSVQPGDYVTYILDGASTVTVNDTANERILQTAGTVDTWTANDVQQFVTYFYNGWDGAKWSWNRVNHGDAYLKKTRNLADVPDKAAARTNLDVFSKAESDARFLALHGTADNATQAANADKLDNYDSTDFVLVKNRQAVAVDANTTTETRFTTNVNTPDSSMWSVVMYIDTVGGTKQQFAMGTGTPRVSFRTHNGTAWSAWNTLDTTGIADSAAKWATPRSITLTGDATGSVSIDGSANVSFATTVESANVNLEDLSAAYAAMKDGVFVDKSGNFTHFLAKDGSGTGLGLKVDNTTGEGQIAYWNGTTWITSRLYADNYHPAADKWTTARTITFTGGLSGSASIDGSANVSIETTVNAGAHTHEISQVNGLQTALDSKLSTSGKAADSELLDGVNGADYSKAIAPTNSSEDPDTTTNELILTNHANTPDGGVSYWYIDTTFYQTRSASNNRIQAASRYNGGAQMAFRQYYSGSWGAWITVAAIVDGNTYNINVSGNAATATSAAKLTTPRNINGVPFDGTANISVTDDAKLPLAGGAMTGPVSRATGTGNNAFKRIDNILSKRIQNGATNGTIKIKLPVTWQNTMLQMKVALMDFDTTGNLNTELIIGGYNSTGAGGGWTNTKASTNGPGRAALGSTIRFAYDGTNCCILIGTTASAWSTVTVAITDVIAAFAGAETADWANPALWDVSIITSETGLTKIVSANYDEYQPRLEQANNFLNRQMITFDAGTPTYSTCQFEINSNSNNPVALAFRRGANGGAYLLHNSSGGLSLYDNAAVLATFNAGAINGTNISASGNASVTGVLTTTGQQAMTGGCLSSSWLRTSGQVGWYSQDYGGGIYMIDTTWVRTYGSKALYVANRIAATGNITAYYSDGRLKENLKPIENALATVKSWTGYHYNANVVAQSFGYDPNKKEIGLIAQDVEKTTPEAVEPAPFDLTATKGKSLTGKHYLTLKYERLVPVLVEAIKEQDAEIQSLKEQVQYLMEEFKKLKG